MQRVSLRIMKSINTAGNVGKKYIRECAHCGTPLANSFASYASVLDNKPFSFPSRPDFCGKCGKPHPWTESEHKKIEDSGFWSLLHPEVVKLAKPRFEAGHYADAVESVFKEINSRIKKIYHKEKGKELDGVDLMRKAFRLEEPVIVLEDIESESGRNIQEGYSHIYAGSMQAIRNPKAHGNVTITTNRACHLLMLGSLLFHRLAERHES